MSDKKQRVEFYNSPMGLVYLHDEGGKQFELRANDRDLIERLLDSVKDCYNDCYKALEKLYEPSKANYTHYRYKMAHRFIRCNCGELDTFKFDLDEYDNLFLEQVKCPLRGSGDCMHEGVICMPTRTSLIKGRQLEVAAKLAEGLCMQQVADALFISIHTVHNIVAQIKFRLQVENSGQIINWYNKTHNQ